ncbi:MAG: radical SAM family heme chaperone HemW [Desulfurivibrionaceae bacterium]|nr:radical SAM family heme chaperone HemW [Desulfurivibrionaceae bacterium]
MKQAGLYLHIPFCRSRCGYCAFNSVAASRSSADHYLQLLAPEIAAHAALPWSQDHTFTSLFIGGGTPSLGSPAAVAATLDLYRRHFRISPQAEISMEANPDTVDHDSLMAWQQAGINRLSIGVQSFTDAILKGLNRVHSGRQAVQALIAARRSGFTNINIDLIYGLPGQTLALWQHDLRQALELAPEHLALYELTIEPGTPFARAQQQKRLKLPDEELVADMEEATLALLTPAMQRYEISNYAQPGRQCGHNLNYWQNGSYLGLGAGAVSCLDGLRLSHEPDPRAFLDLIKQQKSTVISAECLSPRGRFRESMIMGLRLLAGIDLPALERRLHLSAQEVYGDLLADLMDQGMLIREGDMVRLAAPYLAVANQVLTKLV